MERGRFSYEPTDLIAQSVLFPAFETKYHQYIENLINNSEFKIYTIHSTYDNLTRYLIRKPMNQKCFLTVLGLEPLTDAAPDREPGYGRMRGERSGKNARSPL